MKVETYSILGPLLITPSIFEDERGHFFESFSKALFQQHGINSEFVQDNQSLSQKGTLRGLHFQAPPFDQGKLVRVSRGRVIDIIVDIRKSSPTYGQNITVELSDKNKQQLWVPPGFAHGFSVIEDNTIFQYKCTQYYNKASEGGVIYNDNTLALDWKIENPIVSEKDLILPAFKNFNSPFI